MKKLNIFIKIFQVNNTKIDCINIDLNDTINYNYIHLICKNEYPNYRPYKM